MRFREIAPVPELQSIVECIWTLESEPGEAVDRVEPVLPDGCPELVMQFGDRFERVSTDGGAERQADILFAGQLTGQIQLRPTGTVATLGVRFRPGSAAAILKMPQQPLLGTTLGIDALDGSLSRQLGRIRDSSRSPDDAIDGVQACLTARVDSEWLDPRVLAAVGMIRRHHGRMAVAEVATRLGVTRRHLERCFATLVGISPKRLARIVRFQRALRMLQRPPGSSAATALECGYADQPHFIRDFTELAGCPPGAHLLRHAQLSGFFTHADLRACCSLAPKAPLLKSGGRR
jgi:AraC-like DNA-binding protein